MAKPYRAWIVVVCAMLASAGVSAADLTGVTAVASGGEHTCALTTGGGMKCWGYSFKGQLGATLTSGNTPWAVDVVGLASGVSSMTVGGEHTCAVVVSGGARCWGSNTYGQVGNGTTTDVSTPVNVLNLSSGVTSVSAGAHHTCALVGGGVRCWGANFGGQLGTGDNTNLGSPPASSNVLGLSSGVVAISAGGFSSCALLNTGAVRCWGSVAGGSTIPQNVTGATSGVASIEVGGGGNACAVTTLGGVKCWAGFSSATDVAGLTSGVAQVSVGTSHTCARTTGGAMKCWGENFEGQLGNGTLTSSSAPIDVPGLATGVASIATGDNHSCAALTNGTVRCWGDNGLAQIGSGMRLGVAVPVVPAGMSSGVAQVSTGYDHTCARTTAGAVQCWGGGRGGRLGNGSSVDSLTPVQVSGLSSGVLAVASGDSHNCALTAGGGVKCWGTGSLGRLGNGSTADSNVPVDVTTLSSGATAIASGTFNSCALAGGVVKCWGYGAYGQLGGSTDSSVPVNIGGLGAGVSAITVGNTHICALTSGGGAKCWGRNFSGQLGNGTTTDSSVPVDVVGLTSGVVAIQAGVSHTCALISGGAMKCWGSAFLRQLGNGSTVNSSTPVDVTGLSSGVTAMAAGYGHSCALRGGGVKCWGYNSWGQIGTGVASNTDVAAPADVLNLTTGVTSISSFEDHNCALTTGGGARCWGFNTRGQLGNGSPTGYLPTPQNVVLPSPTFLSGNAATFAVGAFGSFTVTATGSPTPTLSIGGALPSGVTFNSTAGVLSGTPAAGTGAMYTLTLTATNSLGSANQTFTLTVSQAATSQSITFGTIADRNYSKVPFPLSATASSGLPVAFSSATPSVCTVTGSSLLMVTAGLCGVNADQPGDGSWNAAPQVLQTFNIAPTAPSKASVSSVAQGYARAIVSFTPPDSDGGTPITSYTATCAPVAAGASSSASGPTSPLTVTGLTPGNLYTCAVVANNAQGSSAPAELPPPPAGAPAMTSNGIDFGGQSMGTTSPPIPLQFRNNTAASVTITGITVPAPFVATHLCVRTLHPGENCTVQVAFAPPVANVPLNGTAPAQGNLVLTTSASAPLTLGLAGTAEKSLVAHYYNAILNREPDSAGKTFWGNEAARLTSLGVNINETWFVMAGYFFNSAEYASQVKNDTQFVTDLYNTFFNRGPDSGGLNYWVGQIQSGLPREVVLFSFMFSNEFRTFTQAIFGNTAARAEVDMVVDFFRGLLNRLPDTASFNYWLGQLRTAQCQGAGPVYTKVDEISAAFMFNTEFNNRNRNNTQFATDMYYSFLRRGGDVAGVQYWINQLNTGTPRNNVRYYGFLNSAEFGARVQAVIAAGCVP